MLSETMDGRLPCTIAHFIKIAGAWSHRQWHAACRKHPCVTKDMETAQPLKQWFSTWSRWSTVRLLRTILNIPLTSLTYLFRLVVQEESPEQNGPSDIF